MSRPNPHADVAEYFVAQSQRELARHRAAERPCYACLEESTHEIRTRSAIAPGGWVWLDVCDRCELEAS